MKETMKNTTAATKAIKEAETVIQEENRLCIDTKLGQLVAYLSTNTEYPGIYIDLKREGHDCMAPIALVEFTATDYGPCGEEIPPSIICRTWGDATKEDYTDAVICRNLDKYFEEDAKAHPGRIRKQKNSVFRLSRSRSSSGGSGTDIR